MFDPLGDIKQIHEKFNLIYNGPPRFLPEELAEFRGHFLREEVIEYLEATDKKNMHNLLDSLVDIVYVALGTSYYHGFDFAEAWRRVHSANMAKKRVPHAGASKRNSTYDLMKPEGWTPPDLTDLVQP